MADVALERVSKTYPNGVRALRDVTLRGADGECVALVGPSGCGKTTRLRVFAGAGGRAGLLGVRWQDAPLAGLDPPLRAEMRRELPLLRRRFPATMLYVTHDQEEALALGDRVGVLDRGVLQQVDRPAVLYRCPA